MSHIDYIDVILLLTVVILLILLLLSSTIQESFKKIIQTFEKFIKYLFFDIPFSRMFIEAFLIFRVQSNIWNHFLVS